MIPLLLLAGEAWARAGGGHGFSGGGDGGDYGGGGSSGGGDGLGLLLWLVFRYPAIGIPVLIIVVIVVIVQKSQQGQARGRAVYRAPPAAAPRAAPDLGFLLPLDPNFSLPLFLDLARLVYVRAHEERGRGKVDVLRPFVSEAALAALAARGPVSEVREVIVGAARVAAAGLRGDQARIEVVYEANLTEVPPGGSPQQWLVRERWAFQRLAATPSPGPDRMRSLACPSCGSPAETRVDGTCTRCDAVVADGRLQWQVVEARLEDRSPLPRIALGEGGGMEEGTARPTLTAPDLGVQMRRFQARHPDLPWPVFRERVIAEFTRIQAAWSQGDLAALRPLETDFLYQQHRYWLDRYRREGLRNRVSAVRVADVVPVKVSMDAYVEAITVRVYAAVKDWTEDAQGKVVGGSRQRDRVFSEYWTFVRSNGARSKAPDLDHCPSCGAPLDRVSETGVCGYCEAKLTGGDYDWVLSAIDQDEVYGG